MKKHFVLFLLIFVFSIRLFAGGKHCLWQVEGQNNKVFLLGSVHMLSEQQYPLPTVFDSVYAQSAALYFETNIDSAMSPQAAGLLMKQGLLNGRQTLKDLLADSVFQKVKKILDHFGQPVELYLKMKPWLLSLMLNQLNMRALNLNPRLGLEMYFSQKVKQDQKPTHGLESFKQQIAFLSRLSEINPNTLVLETIREIETNNKTFEELLTAWQTGDAQALDSLINAGLKEFPQVGEFLLVKRNLNWLQKIEPLLKSKQNYLIVVGAGHLVGDQGLVQLLRQKGYRVQQL